MFELRKIQFAALMVAAMGTFAVAGQAACTSPNTCPNLAYNAVGTFATPAKSGNDLLLLAGQPFHLSVMISEATPPNMTSPPCTSKCSYSSVPVVGTISSGLLPGAPIPLSSGTLGTLTLTVAATGKPDVLSLVFPQTVVGVQLTITASIYLPHGTITSPTSPAPFKTGAPLDSMSGTLTYADTTASTVLSFASGTLTTRAN